MGQIFLNTNREIKSTLVLSRMNVETILIPEKYLNRLSEKERKALPKRILPLLRRYQKLILSLKRINRNARKTLYQRDQGKLIRINMRIDTGIWALLGVLAAAHGVSRCFMVNYLFWLEDSGGGIYLDRILNVGCPTFQNIYSYIWHLNLLKNEITKRLEFEPNPIHVLSPEDFP
ncbi:hypothetical protein A0128_12755 [Leptospira tipperaryensis]|uniref:CopG family transcriptional regulator n=1 Tax=Leptospira tipperaryensis TaxID=2564040 RepID=A0A1D7UYH5_9LEPT|nr:DUF1564 domain-containing protein [Leptospira tipperaryensis]AOP34643.1 hypothetical protein A0128_12755 [Leptospira tipperaryensis]